MKDRRLFSEDTEISFHEDGQDVPGCFLITCGIGAVFVLVALVGLLWIINR